MSDTGRPACQAGDVDPEVFFPDTYSAATDAAAKAVCLRCKRTDECLRFALDNEERHGIWGGLSPKERLRLLLPDPDAAPELLEGQRPGRTEPSDLALWFHAATDYLLRTGTGDEVAAQHQIGRSNMMRAASVLQYAPDLTGPVLNGRLSFTSAVAEAREAKMRAKKTGAA